MNNFMFIAPVDEYLTTNGLPFLIPVVDIIITFAIAIFLSKEIKSLSKRAVARRKKKYGADKVKRYETAQTALVSIIKYVLYFIAIAVSIGELGLESVMTSMLAAAGIGGIALSFGAQSLVKDFTTSLFILFDGSLTVGDYVSVAGVTGTVEAISVRTTSIRADNGELVVVPNGEIRTITNYSCPSYMTFIEVGVAYEVDCDKALDIMMQTAEAYMQELNDCVLNPPARCGVSALGASSVTCRIAIFVAPPKHIAVRREIMRRTKLAFDEAGIEISYNKLVVYSAKAE